MTTTGYIIQVITLLGGLALFLFGMDIMGKSLEQQAGGKLQTILAKMSSTVFRGFLLGVAATAVIQSSSATTVMVVGFVNSGIMLLEQAVGVIMGANVGTTVTSWILSLTALEGDSLLVQLFKPTTLAPLVGIAGIVLYLFINKEKAKGIGSIMLGFLALMTGMDIMSDAMAFLKNEAWFAQLMVSFSNPILGIFMGAVLTAVIQSSSASVGILQGLCSTGAISMGTALPIILGQNIGTCVTALLSTAGANRNARRSAMIHLYFNILGVALFAFVFYGIGAIFPWAFLQNTASVVDIALIHTGFNLTTTLVILPLNKLLVKLAYLTIPEEAAPEQETLLDPRFLATPAVAIQRSWDVAGQMAITAANAMGAAVELTHNFDIKTMEKVIDLENQTDHYEDALNTYLLQLTKANLSPQDNRSLNTLLYTVSDMERIADHALNVAEAGQEMAQKNIQFSQAAQQELAVLEAAIQKIIDKTTKAFCHLDMGQAMKIEPLEQVIDDLVREVKSRHVRRLRDGLCSVEYGFVLEDILTAYERSADHCSNIAVEMLQVAEGKLEAHEYLNALKEGKLQESAKFNQRFQRYRDRYTFPE